MKCLLIENGKGYYSLDGEHKVPLDQITKEDLLKMLDLIIDYDAEMDEYDENLVQHAAHKIIYRNLYSKLKDLSSNKTRFKDESTSLYRSAIERYSIELADENAPYKV
ncbi:hypothetical protein [uncultured Oscillibacter sp.]|uniref:hypothetical protein n=1 Tax=uncultured Oscillibacter sp. TaxID=876091 RepID=UPI002639BF01|nr:hypothetical protein [uncultured Oscillibacter sp.]